MFYKVYRWFSILGNLIIVFYLLNIINDHATIASLIFAALSLIYCTIYEWFKLKKEHVSKKEYVALADLLIDIVFVYLLINLILTKAGYIENFLKLFILIIYLWSAVINFFVVSKLRDKSRSFFRQLAFPFISFLSLFLIAFNVYPDLTEFLVMDVSGHKFLLKNLESVFRNNLNFSLLIGSSGMFAWVFSVSTQIIEMIIVTFYLLIIQLLFGFVFFRVMTHFMVDEIYGNHHLIGGVILGLCIGLLSLALRKSIDTSNYA